MRIQDIILEGGWASAKTQDTVITPATIVEAVKILEGFEKEFNSYLSVRGIPPIRIGKPVGSGTYYKRDLKQQPDKEYGDIDVQFIVPRQDDMPESKNESMYVEEVKSFVSSNAKYETTNGVNVVFEIGDNRYIQVDFVIMFEHLEKWSHVFAPEWNYKGVLSSTLFSALAAVLNLSISNRGIQVKTIDGEIVKFSLRKGTELQTVTTSKENWAMDLAKFLGATQASKRLQQYPGLQGEVKIANIIQSIKGVLESTGKEDLVDEVKQMYLDKVDAVINSSKFDKAESPKAKAKAQQTKEMLHSKSRAIADLF